MIIEDEEDGNQNLADDHKIDNNSSEKIHDLLPSMFNNISTGKDYIIADGGSRVLVDENNTKTMMDFSDDILHKIFSLLEQIDLCGAAMVSKQWCAASAHKDFWRSLNFVNLKTTLEEFKDICKRYPDVIEVNIKVVSVINSVVMKPISSLRHLEKLTLHNGEIHKIFFEILKFMDSLRKLTINEADLGEKEYPRDIVISHDTMTQLQIVGCHVTNISVRCPQLQALSLKGSRVVEAQLNCPILLELDFSLCRRLSNGSVISSAASCPLLESLDISMEATEVTLHEIISNSSSLHILNVCDNQKISLESVRLSMLTVLKLIGCTRITYASMTALEYSSMLEVLDVEYCHSLESVSLVLPHLKTILFSHCGRLVDLNLCSPLLTSITVSNCLFFESIRLTSNLLQKLDLQKLENLITIELQCPCLQEVDLSDCESLTNSACETFNDGGGCPMLGSLVLDNCKGLTAVEFHCISLNNLSLSGCSNITSLKLSCPHLEKFSLDGCDHLEIVSFCPVGLQSLNLSICPELSVLQIEAPSMVVLELKGCAVLSKTSINCPILKSLDASFCRQLTDDVISVSTASYPLIETLILIACPSISPDGFSFLGQLSHLTSLDLSYTFVDNLYHVSDSCLQLKVLRLQACKYLSDSSLEPLFRDGAFPSLCELDLSNGTYSQATIDGLLAYCTQLTHLSLNGCVNYLNFGSHLWAQHPNYMLQDLKCVGCPNIKEVCIPSGACCFNLLSMNLSLSVNLKEVDVACPNLRCLNLRNCYSLNVLKLDCPKLISLSLESSNIDEETLITAISECKLLKKLDIRFCPKIYFVNVARLQATCTKLKCIFSGSSNSLSIC